jgi:hypothetical protein
MEKKANILQGLNDFALTLYVVFTVSIGYLIIKGVRWFCDMIADAILRKYIEHLRKEVDDYLVPMRDKLEKLDSELESVKRHSNNNKDYQNAFLAEIKTILSNIERNKK